MTWGRAVLGFAGALLLGSGIALFLLQGDGSSKKSVGMPRETLVQDRPTPSLPAGNADRPAGPRSAPAEPKVDPSQRRVGIAAEVPKPYSVTVRLSDPNGRPLSRDVFLLGADGAEAGRESTSEEGTCRWGLADPGAYSAVLKEGGARHVSPTVNVTKDHPHAEVRMRLGQFALGGVVVGSGRDLKDESMYLDFDGPLKIHLRTTDSTDDARGGIVTNVDEQGRFVFSDVPAADYVLSIPAKFHFERIRVDRDMHHPVRLSRGWVEGRIVDETSGVGLGSRESTLVVLNAMSLDGVDPAIVPPNLLSRLSPQEDGRFSFTSLPSGRYRLFVFSDRHKEKNVEVTLVGPDDIERVLIELSPKE